MSYICEEHISYYIIFNNYIQSSMTIVIYDYRNKYREGGDCLDIEDRGWVV